MEAAMGMLSDTEADLPELRRQQLQKKAELNDIETRIERIENERRRQHEAARQAFINKAYGTEEMRHK